MTISFLDTNVLVYLNASNDQKFQIVRELIKLGGVISVQVLNEYCTIMTKKYKRDWEEVARHCHDFETAFHVADLTLETQILARNYARRYAYSIYDANIIASAKLAKCEVVMSEDMQHGQIIEGVRITNPFVNQG